MADVKQILQNLGYKLFKAGNYYRTNAEYRGGDNRTSLSVHVKTGRFVDFVANRAGTFEDLIQLTLGLKTPDEAKQWLSNNQFSLGANQTVERPLIEDHINTYPLEILDKLVKNHDYWVNRGIAADVVQYYKGGVAVANEMEGRYTFPIFDEQGRIIGFAGRDVTGKKSIKWKLINPKTAWVYPASHLEPIRVKREAILVESIGDMLALKQAGIDTTLITFGVILSDKLLSSLVRLDPKKIIIAFNNDSGKLDPNKNEVGQKRAQDAYKRLAQFFDLNRITIKIPEHKGDFGEMSIEEIKNWYAK